MIIKLDNIEDGEVFPNPIILISGSVAIQDAAVPHICLIQKINNVCKAHKSSLQGGKFKILVRLNPGSNDLSFQYRNSTRSLSVIFAEVQKQPDIKLLYIVCQDSDGCFQAPSNQRNDIGSACQRISLASLLIQCFFGESLKQHGLPRKTVSFGEVTPVCSVFNSNLTLEKAWSMTGEELWSAHAKEILEHYGAKNETKYLAITSATRYANPDERVPLDFADVLSLTKGHVAFGGGDLALYGSGCLYTWPESLEEVQQRFACQSPVDWRLFMDDSAYRRTMGGCFATSIGAVIHELGHSLDLTHFQEGVMARGFDSMDYFFCVNCSIVGMESPLPVCLKPKSSSIFKSTPKARSGAELLQEYQQRQRLTRIKNACGTAYWNRSSALILTHHRWLNQCNAMGDSSILYADGLLKSSANIVVIELRDQRNDCIDHFEPAKREVELTYLKKDYPETSTVFAINQKGIIIKIEHF